MTLISLMLLQHCEVELQTSADSWKAAVKGHKVFQGFSGGKALKPVKSIDLLF